MNLNNLVISNSTNIKFFTATYFLNFLPSTEVGHSLLLCSLSVNFLGTGYFLSAKECLKGEAFIAEPPSKIHQYQAYVNSMSAEQI